jgi:hypothetical protein
MLVPTIIMGVLAVILFLIGYSRGEGQHIIGMRSALRMTVQILPLLIFAFIVAGMVQVLIPQHSGWRFGPWRPLCQLARRCWPLAGWCRCGHDGCLSDRVVVVGG